MPRAVWNGAVLAESPTVVMVEGNAYFPPETIHREYLEESPTHTTCRWKGLCSYYTVVVNGERNVDAAWYYPDTKPDANHIKGMVAFWRGVKVE
ncbi:MAG TPA: DUF427 domain-containing protein [Alphaproteobacteria bacterium]|jgi:uncharacterized protein (DUF427 family)|nr:DUF427 domain-containing protein [Alphaproteobacteria bacterium]